MDNSMEMPKYNCHKQVWALKIKNITVNTDGKDGTNYLIEPEEAGYAPFYVSFDWRIKHNPQIGGYYVVYKDGYKSFSPAEAFLDEYTLDS